MFHAHKIHVHSINILCFFLYATFCFGYTYAHSNKHFTSVKSSHQIKRLSVNPSHSIFQIESPQASADESRAPSASRPGPQPSSPTGMRSVRAQAKMIHDEGEETIPRDNASPCYGSADLDRVPRLTVRP